MALKLFLRFTFLLLGIHPSFSQSNIREDISLDKNWHTTADNNNSNAFNGFEIASFDDAKWDHVEVPHTWDTYEGYRRMRHGNRHGYAWYRKTFTVKPQPQGKKYFLWFEGVGSYATVWLNGKLAGYHAGGRTTFTIDVSSLINHNKPNILAVRADHPANIQDLPWVCGGCSDERGFSEGSQPMGIFRPVHLVITSDIRVEPFGIHIWNDTTVSTSAAQLQVETEIKNYSDKSRKVRLLNRLVDNKGIIIFETATDKDILPLSVSRIHQQPPVIKNPHLWSLEDPYLYRLVTDIIENGKVIDRVTTSYGIRWISWPVGRPVSANQFFLNGRPVFINGIAEYEHLIGKSHAFSTEQVRTRAMEIKAAGFNAFRDAHQPHNLRYQNYWDSLGLLWWTQLSAHIWFDTPEFRKNFKQLLTDWVKERRNSPSVVLWGLQNESKLPTDFAQECTELIRQLDPTASSQRKVTTCNGGTGTDWDVPQNWTGTYGGNPATYGDDVKRQVLVGEYGAWRTLDLHTEGAFAQNGFLSEDRMTQLMEMKIRLAEAEKDSTTGHFMWLLTSHDNPGRVQGGEGYRELDRVGPVNYKGLLTPWEEPLDVFYMYRSNYAPKETEPMVYIVSHTWPDRWITTGRKDSIIVYSNCDEVELFNDAGAQSLGKRKREGIGTHFQWDGVNINYNVLYAVGYIKGKEVAKDYILLHHLPPAPHLNIFLKDAKPITQPQKGYNYLYRVNCGGPDYVDKTGNTWLADRERTSQSAWGSKSWTAAFPGMPAFFASQRKIDVPIKGTADWKLFQDFRYGRENLRYEFPVPDGDYLVELYFTEPWLGTGGGMDCKGWRLFDVAVNNKIVLKDVDLWKEAGYAAALKKTIKVRVTGGQLMISFPRVASGQAVISAIAIASTDKSIKPASSSQPLAGNLSVTNKASGTDWIVKSWLDTGDEQYSNEKVAFRTLPPNLYGAEWICTPASVPPSGNNRMATFSISADADVFIAMESLMVQKPAWIKDFEDTKTLIENGHGKSYKVFRKRYTKGTTIILGDNGLLAAGDATMYTVVITPATTIEPAYDLKPVASYKAASADLEGPGLVKTVVDGKERALFSKASQNNIIAWNVAVGAADIYSLTISYNNPGDKTISGNLQLFAADGTLMKEEAVEFTPTRPGKSNYINSSTGTMINAGNYKVKLRSKDAGGISINSLDVQ